MSSNTFYSRFDMRKEICTAIVFLLMASTTYAQKASGPLFKNGDTVSFIGNSITHSGNFHHYIALYYATHFPNEKVTFKNLGIRGDNTNSFLKRMDKDILNGKSDWYIIMTGMNDVNRLLYNPDKNADPEIQKQKVWALNDYRKNYEKVIQRLLLTGAKIILQKPSIYDQTGSLPALNQFGVNDALEKCTEIIDELAQKYKLKVIDYFTIMKQVNQNLQNKDPKQTIVGNDRVHPGAPGHLVMAYQFLKSTGVTGPVSMINLEKGKIKKLENAKLRDLTWTKDAITFKLTENSLPFPLSADATPALNYIPFNEELNLQLLKISGLDKVLFTLKIDGMVAGKFSAEQLHQGINLSLLEKTPQMDQAKLVEGAATAYRNLQRRARDLKFVEYSYFPKNISKVDLTSAGLYIDSTLTKFKSNNERKFNEVKPQFDAYLKDKPNEANLGKNSALLLEQMYQINKPKEHIFEVILNN